MEFELPDLGWNDFFEQQLASGPAAGLTPARVAAEHRGAYEVWSPAGSGWARLAGRLRHDLQEQERPGAGDWVALDASPGDGHVAIIQHVFERRSVFVRGAAGRQAVAQVVAANVDLVFVVCGLDEDFNPRRIERYVARVRASGARPVVLLNKADVAEDGAARVAEVEARMPGLEVRAVSALRRDGLEAVRALVGPGETAALVGSSGAGKSTLANGLVGEERMQTGPVRSSDGRGQHVTTHRQLVMLPGGGLLLDTPGMRELQLLDETGLADAFDDVSVLAGQCRFTDCGHGAEPGCAVRAAVAAGWLDGGRVEHFLQLRQEARASQRRRDPRLSRLDERAWGRMVQVGKRQMSRKRGE